MVALKKKRMAVDLQNQTSILAWTKTWHFIAYCKEEILHTDVWKRKTNRTGSFDFSIRVPKKHDLFTEQNLSTQQQVIRQQTSCKIQWFSFCLNFTWKQKSFPIHPHIKTAKRSGSTGFSDWSYTWTCFWNRRLRYECNFQHWRRSNGICHRPFVSLFYSRVDVSLTRGL